MEIEVKLPEIGEGVDSGGVLQVLVQEGDVVNKEQDLVELETDKATMGVPSSHAGKILKIHVKEGETIAVGDRIVTLEATETSTKDEPKEPEPAPKKKKAPKRKQTKTTVDESRGSVKRAQGRKPAVEEPSPKKQPASEPAIEPASERTAEPPPTKKKKGKLQPAGPAIRRFAREVGVDLATVTGTGPSGRITREDVLEVVRRASSANQSQQGGEGERDSYGAVRYERLTRIRKTIADRMHQSWSTIPRVTNFDDADVTELEKMRQASKADYEAIGVKLTSMPFLIKASALALKKHPLLNAALDLENNRIIYKEYVNIGVAVDTERGLVVPVIRDADEKSIAEIARELVELANKVRDNQFSIEETRGGSFTISNLGAIGGTYSTPVINLPEVAILLVGRSRKLPVVIDDQIAIRLMMPMSISYDHRLIDGAAAARFLNEVIGYLKAPGRLLLAP